ncbi:alpha/beta-hydrolase [Byssothecium circinans]|uniref:Alpha/beta-hydrolase n=1 Tax=Byssothecium circinans TaxID=147558 RepID=A0A6A5UE86_9PLEO|nr:alpha/beta-hydrolase [Byssothecium circinans]
MACADCFRGGTAIGTPQGTVETHHSYPTYVATPPSTSTTPTKASTVILFTDAFGLKLVNNKLLADTYAAETGCRVLVPDIIPGGPMSTDVLPLMDTMMSPVSLWDLKGQVWRAWCAVRAIGFALPFLWYATPNFKGCLERCLKFARAVKKDIADEGKGGKLGVAGFCWGGYQATNLCAYPAVEGTEERLVDAHFCAHPSLVKTPDDFVNAVVRFKTPVCIAHAGNDMALSNQQMDETEAALRQKTGSGDGEGGYHWQIRRYEGCGHGFAVRARPESEVEGKGAEEARGQAVEWFKRWL